MAQAKNSMPLGAFSGQSPERSEELSAETGQGQSSVSNGELRKGIAGLMDRLSYPEEGKWRAVIEELAGIGQPAVPYLTKGLESTNRFTRGNAAAALGRMGKQLAAAPQPLLQLLKDNYAPNRVEAAVALGSIRDAAAAPELLKALCDPEPEVRANTAWALGQIKIAETVLALLKALHDPEPEVRAQSAWALGEIRNTAGLTGLRRALGDKDPMVRKRADYALREIRDAAVAVPSLREELANPAGFRADAARSLGWIRDAGAVPALLDALLAQEAEVRANTAWALGQIGDAIAVPGLAAAFRQEANDEIRRTICEALGRLRATAKAKRTAAAAAEEEAESILLQARSHDHSKVVRIQAAMELHDSETESQADLPVLVHVDDARLPALSHDDLAGYLKPLWLVYRIRVICREEGTTRFTAPSITKKLTERHGMDISLSAVKKHLQQVNKLFADHFQIEDFSLFDSSPKVGYEFIHGDETIDRAWDLIERVGRPMEQLPIAQPRTVKKD